MVDAGLKDVPKQATALAARARAVLDRAISFGAKQGLATYDPYDLKSLPWVVKTYRRPSFAGDLARSALYGAELVAPILTRRLAGVPKRVAPGGVAAWASANLSCHRLTGRPEHLAVAETCLRWLLDNPGRAHVGIGWGLPFLWPAQFGNVPPGTAVAHTTHCCGSAFHEFAEVTGASWAREAAVGCRTFFAEGLNRKEHAGRGTSLSYTAEDESQVVNVSSGAAALLRQVGRQEDSSLIDGLVRFVVASQSEDGSWPYFSPWSVRGFNPIDHYHTAMVLHDLAVVADVPGAADALRKGVDFHLARHFEADGAPRMRPDILYPLDAHSAGSSILLFTRLSAQGLQTDEARTTLHRLVAWTLDHLACADGGFLYRLYRHKSMRFDSLRWAHALLCQGLAEFCLAEGLES